MEIWKDVKGYEGLYEVSNTGRVKSKRTDKIISVKKNNRGYSQIHLFKDSKAKMKLLHRVVAEAFIPNPNNLPQVNHKDENKDNNQVDNLEWCTNLYNRRYGSGYRRSVEKHDYKALGRLNSKPVIQMDTNNNIINIWYGVKEAERNTGINESSIRQCCYGRNNTAGGYKWCYLNGKSKEFNARL